MSYGQVCTTIEASSRFSSREEWRAWLSYTRLVEGTSRWQDREYAYDPGMSWENFKMKNGVENE